MLPHPLNRQIVTHWGTYTLDGSGKAVPVAEDAAPSVIGQGLESVSTSPARVTQPMVRQSWLEKGHKAGGAGRGREPFVPVDWATAEKLVADEITRIRDAHGNAAIFGGSYGWGSAGRFHHAQSQVHRFLNVVEGYTRSVQNYSYAAGDVILPHVIGSTEGLTHGHTSWRLIRENAKQVLMFGGMPSRNMQVGSGGVAQHESASEVEKLHAAGVRLVLVSPIGDDAPRYDEWLALRPNTDVALMLAMVAHVIAQGAADMDFLQRYTVGWQAVFDYVQGVQDGVVKDAEWAAGITGLDPARIRALAQSVIDQPSFIAMSWSLQRARHGEQPYWMAITLAAVLGTIGKEGLGFGFGYGSVEGVGGVENAFSWPKLPQGRNPVDSYIPVARIADMLLQPGENYRYNGLEKTYPDIRMIYWAGGNPFHHHQDLNRLVQAWRRPECIVVQEPWWTASARHADIVLPATMPTERNDIACTSRGTWIKPSHQIAKPPGMARDDYDIFRAIVARLGAENRFTEGRDTEAWLRHLYAELCLMQEGLPDFDTFWTGEGLDLAKSVPEKTLLADFRADPVAHALNTPSGKIELYSSRIAAFGYSDCKGQATWLPPEEWLGSALAQDYPLHLISSQPRTRLHSQMDAGPAAQATKVSGREVMRMHPVDAAARGLATGDIARVFNARGACLVGVETSTFVAEGVLQLPTGAWFDPCDPQVDGSLDGHGNPNALTRDIGASQLSQGPAAQSCLVEVEKWSDPLPRITVFDGPDLVHL